MKGPFYFGGNGQSRQSILDLPEPIHFQHDNPSGYHPDPGLATAFNVSLMLGQPLLVTGEPGTGKTSFAYAVAYELGLSRPLEVRVKSTTSATNILYQFDELSIFRDSQLNRDRRPLAHYLRFNGLGEAILRAAGPAATLKTLQGDDLSGTEPLVREALGSDRALIPPTCSELLPGLVATDQHPIVLIDELDKAPRDTPNDLLREIENLAFDIPELGLRVSLDEQQRKRRPIIIITSNSEKSLPDAFLRRCVFYHIEFPENDDLRKIVEGRIGVLSTRRDLLDQALELFPLMRVVFRKPPGTAELLGWLELLSNDSRLRKAVSLRHANDVLMDYLPTLAKLPEDLKEGRTIVSNWTRAN
jgi:MoxR-like ATPase